ncbi:MAG: acyl-phosphate glycerol 3-phosphate acyltransferase [Chloroflexi bacterium RBG_16_72_14]|nr:MAG: acyl-phosphate glycerol 3-phosphate acyltransferase [Chloroflexi bacterium RBG_16_72_14]
MDAGEVLVAVVLALLSYAAGSVPFGLLVARVTGAPDPRRSGSGRTGGTNALRAMGRKRALVVVTGDVLKGVVPVLVARFLTGNAAVEVLCAIAAILGSTRSVFVGFKGGRGVATSVGTMVVIFPPAILIGAPVFVGVILATRYVSLGSLLATAAGGALVVVWWLAANGSVPFAYPVYATLGAALVWLAHADNIDRLIHGTERRFDLDLLARD